MSGWREWAACKGQPTVMRASNAGPAKRLCARCPVAEACLFSTLAAELPHRTDRYFTAGGMTAPERTAFQRYLDGRGLDVHELAADEIRFTERRMTAGRTAA